MLKPRLLKKMVNNVYLGLGSNKGDRITYLNSAIEQIESLSGCNVISRASLYESGAYGYKDQGNFLNTAILVKTDLDAVSIFNSIKEIEKRTGRQESFRWGPREIDIDIILYGDKVISNDIITIPHKDMLNRDFVLYPLIELNKELKHPVENKPLIFYIDKLERNIFRKFNWKSEEVEFV